MKHHETAECRECGMKIHLDPDGDHPDWFERRICTCCVDMSEYPNYFQGIRQHGQQHGHLKETP